MARIERPFYPIIYVRGYAMTRDEVIQTTSTPYMGFEAGSTKIRQAQDGSVIVVQVPTTAVEVTPGFKVDPPTLLAALDQYGIIHLALEPVSGVNLDVSDVVTLNLGELYEEMNDHRKKD